MNTGFWVYNFNQNANGKHSTPDVKPNSIVFVLNEMFPIYMNLSNIYSSLVNFHSSFRFLKKIWLFLLETLILQR